MTMRLTPGVSRDVVGEDVGRSVMEAMGRVPRHAFLPAERRMTAYLDRSVPLGRGRRCPRPSVVARMLDACPALAGGRALVVGVGSGYIAACAAEMAAEVVGVESDEELLGHAASALGATSANAVTLRQALPRAASMEVRPFDAIIVCGAVSRTPRRLLAGLSESGTLVVPIEQDRDCSLFAFRRAQRGHLRRDLGPVDIESLPQEEADAC